MFILKVKLAVQKQTDRELHYYLSDAQGYKGQSDSQSVSQDAWFIWQKNLQMFLISFMHALTHFTYLPAKVFTQLHACMHACMHVCMHKYICIHRTMGQALTLSIFEQWKLLVLVGAIRISLILSYSSLFVAQYLHYAFQKK